MKSIPFNKPFLSGKELVYIQESVASGKISGDGKFTSLCSSYFQSKFGFKKCLLTTSCTDALEMAALLINIQPGDEVIIPSYTFVSTANAFVLRGAKVVFIDSKPQYPGLEENQIEELITPKTRAIVPVHYAGIACDMDIIMNLAKKYNLFVIEDAAQAIDSYYNGKPLGSIGHLATFSFHETKNVISGEGGMLVVNDEAFIERAEIIREKGTNRSQFFRGEIDKYGWIDIGSSFLPSDIIAAFLFAQLENLEKIQNQRLLLWKYYQQSLQFVAERCNLRMPFVPAFGTNNAHMFYLVCNSLSQRDNLIKRLREDNIHAVFHYISLHSSAYFKSKHDGRDLPNSDHYSDCLVRMPMFYELDYKDIDRVVKVITVSE